MKTDERSSQGESTVSLCVFWNKFLHFHCTFMLKTNKLWQHKWAIMSLVKVSPVWIHISGQIVKVDLSHYGMLMRILLFYNIFTWINSLKSLWVKTITVYTVLRCSCDVMMCLYLGECVGGKEDSDALQRQWPWEPDRVDLSAPLWKHCVIPLVLHILTNTPQNRDTEIWQCDIDMKMSSPFFLLLPGTGMGIYWLDSPLDILWWFPLTLRR